MAEIIQSDLRQTLLMYMADFTNHQAYRHHFLFEEAVTRYAPLKGTSVIDVIRETKRLIEIIAIIGGQWPHTSFMVPGGVTLHSRYSSIDAVPFDHRSVPELV